MANILGILKKRLSKGKPKQAAPDADKLTLESLVELKEKLGSEPDQDYSRDFSAIVKEFFQKFFKIKYKFTYEELISEAEKSRLSDDLKIKISSLLEELSSMEYSGKGFDQKTLPRQLQRFEDLVIKLSYVKAVPGQKSGGSAKKQKAPKKERLQKEPSPLESFKEKAEETLGKKTKGKKASKKQKQVQESAPEELQGISDDELGAIYDLFSQAYEAISSNDLDKSTKLYDQIKSRCEALDSDTKEQFVEEFSNLDQSLSQLRSEQEESNPTPEKKSLLSRVLPKKRKQEALPDLPPEAAEPPRKKSKKQPEDIAAPKEDLTSLKEQLSEANTSLKFRHHQYDIVLRSKEKEAEKKEASFNSRLTGLTKQVEQLTKLLDSKQEEFDRHTKNHAEKHSKREQQLLDEIDSLKEQLSKTKSDVLAEPVEDAFPQKSPVIKKHDILKKELMEVPHRIEGPTVRHLVDKFIRKKDVTIEPQPILPESEEEELPRRPQKKVRLVVKKKPKTQQQETGLSPVTHELMRNPPPPAHEFRAPELAMPAEKEPSTFDRLIGNIIHHRKKEEEPAPDLPKLSGFDTASHSPEKISQLVDQIYEDIGRKKQPAQEPPKPIPTLTKIQPAKEAPKPDSDSELLVEISGLIKEIYAQLAWKDLSGTQKLWEELKLAHSRLSEPMKSEILPEMRDIEQHLQALSARPPAKEEKQPDYNEKIAGVLRSWQSSGIATRAPVVITEKKAAKSRSKSVHASQSQPKALSPAADKPASAKNQKKAPRQPLTVEELDSLIGSARALIRSNRLDDARDAYEKALTMRKRLKLTPELKSKINYDLMDINVELRMAEIK